MYKVIGQDGKEYGPITSEQLKEWIGQGRLNAQSKVRHEAAAEWRAAAEVPELAGSFPAVPQVQPGTAQTGRRQGFAITSLVLGIVSFALCLGALTGIPAVIFGHIAHSRARKNPSAYGGAGVAIAGFVMGYVSIVLTLFLLPAMLLPALAKAKTRAQEINCVSNMKQIGLSFRVWALDNNDLFPFNVSTNNGGTLELCSPGPGGFDLNGYHHLRVMSNEFSVTRILCCPADSRKPASDFSNLTAQNVSYQVRSGTNVSDVNPEELLATCPFHGHNLTADGAVLRGPRNFRPARN
jgi:hypothetical protein